uniref:Uncharacterized protein n=1 Tax=uncultured bacterium Contig1468_n_1482_cl TaxID=1393431 RepID=W0FNH3_9BACT|nr:hypothetical protein [uncultured bacterium Contig1468_n_1482_cl]
MKKIMMILCIVFCCLLCLAGTAAAEIIETPEGSGRIWDITSIDRTVYVRTSRGQVYAYQPDSGTLDLYASGFGARDYNGLFAVDGVLYTIKKDTYQFVGVGENAQGTPLDGLIIPDFKKVTHAREGWEIFNVRNTSSGLFWMMNPSDSENACLCRFDPEKQKLSCRSVQMLHEYCVSEDGTIWIVQLGEKGRVLSSCNWKSGKLEKAAVLSRAANGFVTQDNSLVWNDREDISRRMPDGSVEHVMYMPVTHSNRINSLLVDDDILVNAFDSRFACKSIRKARENTGSLTVLDTGARDEGSYAFQNEHPEIEVRRSRLGYDTDFAELNRKMLSGELEYDVLRISTSDVDLRSLAEKGCLADLSCSSALTEAVQQMEPRLLDMVMPDGRLLAVPCRISGNFIKYYADNLARAEFSPADLPATYDEFFDFILNWKQAPFKSHNRFKPFFDDASDDLLQELIRTAIADRISRQQPLAFDTEAFRSLLQKCRQAAASAKQENGDHIFFDYARSPIVDRQTMLLAMEESIPDIPVSVDCYIINPMSANLELAVSYVESCVAQYTPEQKLQLYPAYTGPVKYDGYESFIREWTEQKEALEAQLAGAGEKDRAKYRKQLDEHMDDLISGPAEYIISPEDIAFYKNEIAPRIFIPDISVSRLLFSDEMPFRTITDEWLKGRLTDDQFIAELDSACVTAQ